MHGSVHKVYTKTLRQQTGPDIFHFFTDEKVEAVRTRSKLILDITIGKKIPVQIHHKQGLACVNYRSQTGMKAQEDYATTEKSL